MLKVGSRFRLPTESIFSSNMASISSHSLKGYITSITGENLLIYPFREWEEIEAKLSMPPKMLPEKEKFLLRANFYGQASSMDKQGRVLIQTHLRETAQVDGEVAVMGYLTYLQVWNRERVQNLLKSDPYTNEDATALAELGI